MFYRIVRLNSTAVRNKPRILIVGAGFGGLSAAQSFVSSNAEVVLIDRNAYHTFTPLLYQVATAELEPELIAYPTHRLVSRLPNTQLITTEVTEIDFSERVVRTCHLDLSYDFLILATGNRSQFLGVPGAAEYALRLTTLQEAVKLRKHLLDCFKQAVKETDKAVRQSLLTVVIVGGGPTGIELAGSLMELIQKSLTQEYPSLNVRQVQIILLHSGEQLLADLPQSLGRYALKKLRQMGVKVHFRARVTRVMPQAVQLETGDAISSATIVWTAGVEASQPKTVEPLPTAEKGKIVVRPTLQLPHQSCVYAIGDLAHVMTQQGKPLTGVAPEAIQQGIVAAQNIKRQLQGRSPRPFRYFNKGRLAIIGRNAGVGLIAGIRLTGFLPWLLWLIVHFVYLPGFRNRFLVVMNWLL